MAQERAVKKLAAIWTAFALVASGAALGSLSGCSTVKGWFGGNGPHGLDEEDGGKKSKAHPAPASALSQMEGEDGLSNDDLAEDEEDSRLAIDATVEADDGLLVRIVVRVDKDKKSVAFDYLGDVEQLEWDGAQESAAGGRNYANDRFKATVTFPSDSRDAGAAVIRK